MARYAILIDGAAVNFAEADADYAEGKGWVLAEQAGIGDTWDGTAWHTAESPPPVPEVVTRAQGKAALVHFGKWAAVLEFVAAIPDDTQRLLAEIALNDTQEWRRDSPFLAAAADALGLTEAQMDGLFVYAATVQL